MPPQSGPTDPEARFHCGVLHSDRFGDPYFSREGGLAEARTVFLDGCGLPGGWSDALHFTVAELGFGCGLNMLATLDLWQRTRRPGARLHLFSVEGFLLSKPLAAEALTAFPELSRLARQLLDQWPQGRTGFQRLDFAEADATLDIALCDVEQALGQWCGRADAWFLDGFAPARNPAMWQPAIFGAVARASRPGARVATYSAAGEVRRGLAAAGFDVQRLPGFGSKRHRLAGRLPGAASRPERPTAAIIGAGIAGAALARALRDQGVEALHVAAGPSASRNPAALVSPRLDAGAGDPARLHAAAFLRSVDRIERTAAHTIIARGAIRLAASPRDHGRFAAVRASGLLPGLSPLPPDAAAARLAEPAAPEGLWLDDALVIDPAALCAAWAGEILPVRIEAVRPAGGGWELRSAGRAPAEVDLLFLAAGAQMAALCGVPLRYIRGQCSIAALPFSGAAATWGHYCIPTGNGGTLFGATHDRDRTDADILASDHDRNRAALATIRPALADRLAGLELDGRAAIRVAPRDTQPVAGVWGQGGGLHMLTGLGGRGFSLAPLLAEHVVAQALDRPSPLARPLARLVAPGRLAGQG